VLKFIEKHMLKVKADGAVWGYDVPYLLTGHLNQHPSAGIDYIKNNQTAYSDFYTTLLDRD
jgi:4-hydroxy 2-oxovalerate aldolase